MCESIFWWVSNNRKLDMFVGEVFFDFGCEKDVEFCQFFFGGWIKDFFDFIVVFIDSELVIVYELLMLVCLNVLDYYMKEILGRIVFVVVVLYLNVFQVVERLGYSQQERINGVYKERKLEFDYDVF